MEFRNNNKYVLVFGFDGVFVLDSEEVFLKRCLEGGTY